MAKTNKVRMTNGFVIMSMCSGTEVDPRKATASDLMRIAADMPEVFPEGLTREQAEYLLKNQSELVGEG
jgi:hypothetical protein